MADLVVIVPSRGRPHSVAQLAEDFAATTGPEARMVVAVDDDDPQLPGYRRLPIWELPQFQLREGKRLRLGGTLNEVATSLVGQCKAIGFMGDDHRPRTDGWAQRVLEVLRESNVHIAYGDDRLQGERLPTAAFLTSDVVRTLGYMAPAGLKHMFIDDAWKAWGEGVGGLRYLPEIIVEHLHPAAGKACEDEGYREVWALTTEDSRKWDDYRLNGGLAADVEKLQGLK